MPVDHSEQQDTDRPVEGVPDGSDETMVAGTPVVVRRHAGVAALVGGAASAVAIAYLWRASQTMTVLDWALFGVMSVIAAVYLVSLVDARTPLLVADDLGVRIRLGDEWRGLPWDAIGQVIVHPRKGVLRDGRLVVREPLRTGVDTPGLVRAERRELRPRGGHPGLLVRRAGQVRAGRPALSLTSSRR